MLIRYYKAENTEEQSTALDANKPETIFVIKHHEVEKKSGSGDHFDVCRIDIERTDGQKAVGRFWVDVHFNRQGKPVLHVATNVGNSTNTKKLTGEWR